ncbi:MAG TPA: potassium-transporting ATPase subunit KdpA [Terriglobales bacterium]|nr:potassium-transporting ATPase subunit KdpA [Terriglobales bacterium]
MILNDWLQIIVYVLALILLTPVLGAYIARVFASERPFSPRPLAWIERMIYRFCRIDPYLEMGWMGYTKALLIFNFLGFAAVLLLQLIQPYLPVKPPIEARISIPLAFNTAVSFMTNTNWQSYAGETTLSYLTQMLGLAVQNFLSAATGLAVLLALIRGIKRKSTQAIGNFWTDLVKSTIYVLLPLAIILSVILVSQGVVQTFSSGIDATNLEGAKQTIPLGPVASQIAIKQLGTNGGGYFNANSAHPFENPTPLSNFLELLSILLIPAALAYTYGKMINSKKHGWILFGVMLFVWLLGLGISAQSEFGKDPSLGNLTTFEGKETRFGTVNSILWSTATTVASNGSVNSMHDSLTPLSGGVAMLNIQLGEIIFGGVGVGLTGMLLFALMTVFLAGLMGGRTPEYLGKKIEAKEIQMVIVAILAPSAVILIGAGFASILPVALSSIANKGPHGFSEILYAYSSAAGNNGSAFAGLNANTDFYNITLAITMLIGRFAPIIATLVIAGSLAQKRTLAVSSGTFSTDTFTFAVLLFAVIIIIGALTFMPALCLGPIIEHMTMLVGRLF